MTKKGLLMLVLAVFIAGGVFAQSNTITVDVGPTIFGLLFGQAGKIAGNIMNEELDIDSSGFGIAAQYERQVIKPLAIAVRGAYLGLNTDMNANFVDPNASGNGKIGMDLKSFSAEGQARFYPGNTFFLGGMLGYGNLALGFSGDVKVDIQGYGPDSDSVKVNMARNYIKAGARLGWRIDFGKPGGFVFEPSFGYDFAFGLGDSFVAQLDKGVDGSLAADYYKSVEKAFKMLENYAFAGGPRLTLGFGVRF